jgi:hypothetical protein
MKTSKFLALCLCASVAMSGCAAINSVNGQPARQPTAMEQVMTWNADLADSNLAIAKGVIAASEASQIDVPTANAILTEQSRIADADRQLTPILAKSCTPQSTIQACNPAVLSGDAATIQGFLTQIQTSGTNLVNSGTAGIKDPAKQQSVNAAITAINTLAGEMVSSLQALGVLK